MRRVVLTIGGLVAILVVMLVVTPVRDLLAQGGTPSPEAGLHFDVQFRDTILTESDTGLSLGDRFILSDLLLQDGEVVGHNSGLCTITDTAGEAICTVTFVLPEGTISTQFVNSPPPEKVFAITGGTGAYQGARGYGELVENPDQTGILDFYVMD